MTPALRDAHAVEHDSHGAGQWLLRVSHTATGDDWRHVDVVRLAAGQRIPTERELACVRAEWWGLRANGEPT